MMKNKQIPGAVHYFVSENIDNKNKEAIFFIHPAFADHRTFNKQINEFSSDYRIVAIDLLGHGLSQKTSRHEKIHDTSKQITEILLNEGIEKAHFVGVSIGSLLAQDFANKYPSKVISLSSVGGYDINNYDSSVEKNQRKQQGLFILSALFSIRAFSKKNADVSAYTKQGKEEFFQMNLLFKRRSFRYMTTLNEIMNKNSESQNFPLCIMYGEHDDALAIKLSTEWFTKRENSQLVCIKNAGHCANMDNPTEFNQVLRHFLNAKPVL